MKVMKAAKVMKALKAMKAMKAMKKELMEMKKELKETKKTVWRLEREQIESQKTHEVFWKLCDEITVLRAKVMRLELHAPEPISPS
jgi:hypothetical protein